MNRVTAERPRVLLVEDHKELRRLLSRLLYLAGWEVVEARDLSEAYACLATRYGAYRAAIVDLMLPDGSGSDFVRDIKAIRGAARVVVCTACLRGGPMARAAIAAGADAVHYKPLDFESRLLPILLGDDPGDEPTPPRNP